MKSIARRVVMLTESYYPVDTRVRNEATLLQSSGYEVSVIALRAPGKVRSEVLDGVRVYRLPHLELFKKSVFKESFCR
jgi:hypothetical protein